MDDVASLLPSPFEKLSLKFILDEIRDRKYSKEMEGVAETVEVVPAVHEISEVGVPPIGEEEQTESINDLSLPLGKKYFRIGEVSTLLGIEAHVLRYWESEFRSVRPVKTSAGHRVYTRKDVQTLYRIQQLLHIEKFSIKGAKRALLKEKKAVASHAPLDSKYRTTLKDLASDLKILIHHCKQW